MYYKNEIVRYLQANNILALKLEHAVAGAEKAVANQIETIGAGAKRALYYTSCFTDEYQDVCLQQKTEDIRFKNGVIYLLKHGNIAYDMLKLYFEQIFKDKASEELERIKRILMAVKEVAIKWSAAPDMTPQTVLYRRPVAQFSNFQPKIVSSWLILALFQANFLISGRSRLCPYQLVNSNQVRQGE